MARRRISERYVLCEKLGAGGQASVHYGRILGASGFSRTVAIKRLNEGYADDPTARALFLDEARLASRIRHPNVVDLLDVVESEDELFLVMEYVPGLAVARLQTLAREKDETCPPEVAATIACDVLRGLHAAHEATNERGERLCIIHRDVSPQNVLLGRDGVARVLDFGIAKAVGRQATTETGVLKGKLPYMAPEQLRDGPIDHRVDVFAAGVLLWELLVGQRLYGGNEPAAWTRILNEPPRPPSELVPGVSAALSQVVVRALCKDREGRYPTALAMAEAIEQAIHVATPTEVGVWVESVAGVQLRANATKVEALERDVDDESTPSFARDTSARARGENTANVARYRGVAAVAIGIAVAALVAMGLTFSRIFHTAAVEPAVARDVPAISSADEAPVASSPVAAAAPAPPPAAPPSATTPVSAAPTARPPSPTRNGARSAGPRAPNCTNPFTVNANGHKVFRAECAR